MKRKLVILLMLYLCFILQSSVFPMIGVLSATPNLMMILVTSIGFMQGKTEGAVTGFFAGLPIDIFFGTFLGYYSLLYVCAGFISGCFTDIYFDEDIKVPLLLVTGNEFLFNLIIYITNFLMRGRTSFGGYLTGIILPEIVSTVLFTVFLYRLFYKINHALVEKEKNGSHSLWIRE